MYLSQFFDNYLYNNLIKNLNIFKPTEVIISSKNSKINLVRQAMTNNFKNLKFTVVNSKYFDKQKGITKKVHFKYLFHHIILLLIYSRI